jgi:hypothetical protein
VIEAEETEETVDMFEHVEELPQDVQDILEQFSNDWDDSYIKCSELLTALNAVGYTCDYYLDAIPYNLRKLEII